MLEKSRNRISTKDYCELLLNLIMINRRKDNPKQKSKEGILLVDRRKAPRVSIELPYDVPYENHFSFISERNPALIVSLDRSSPFGDPPNEICVKTKPL